MSRDVTHYAWIDLETTGLDRVLDPIIEIAMILTDTELNRIRVFSSPIQTEPRILEERLMDNDYVREMHTKNGLLSCFAEDTKWPTVKEAEERITTILAQHATPGEVMIAGSGVAQFDQQVIRVQMPSLSEWFAYYPMDIGVIRRFIKHTMQRPDLLLPEANSTHRALDDTQRALQEARHYASAFSEIDLRALDEEG